MPRTGLKRNGRSNSARAGLQLGAIVAALICLGLSPATAQDTRPPERQGGSDESTAPGSSSSQDEIQPSDEGEGAGRSGRRRRAPSFLTEDGELKDPTWFIRTRLGNAAKLEFPTGERSEPRVAIERIQTGVAWHLRLGLAPFAMKGKAAHIVQFRARADGPRTLSVGVSQAVPPFRGLGTVVDVELTPLWTNYRVRVFLNEDEPAVSLLFSLGANRYSVELADVQVVRNDGVVVLEAPSGSAERRERPASQEAESE